MKWSHVAKKGDIVVTVTDMERRNAPSVPTLRACQWSVNRMWYVLNGPCAHRAEAADAQVVSLFVPAVFAFADEVKQHANGANVLQLAPERITDFPSVRFHLLT